jgi:hypothetical protein
MDNINDLVLLGGRAFVLHEPPTLAEKQALYAAGVLCPERLEHGVSYAGLLRSRPVFARWHARKRRFVYAEYTMASQQVRAIRNAFIGTENCRLMPVSEPAWGLRSRDAKRRPGSDATAAGNVTRQRRFFFLNRSMPARAE